MSILPLFFHWLLKKFSLLIMVVLLTGLALSLSQATSVWAATSIYVRPDGDNVNCDGTTNDPYPDTGEPGLACAVQTIQQGVDLVNPGGTVRVYPGDYSETASNRTLFDGSGPYQFGLFIDQAKSGITIQGVDNSDTAITHFNNVLATVNTNATNNFGPSGIFVEGDNVTIAGLRAGTNSAGQNKTIEVIGDNFTLKNSDIADPQGSVYLNDWRFDATANTSHIQGYRFEGNNFQDGVSLDLVSGAGFSGPVSGRVITGNHFANSYSWPSISFTSSGTGVPWFVHPVGGAIIQTNTFTNTASDGQIIRARGDYDNNQFDWTSYWNDNSFNKAVIAGLNPLADVRTYSYTSGSYTISNVRRIGAVIQPEIDHSVSGDTVLVKAGIYNENLNVNKHVAIIGAGSGNDPAGNTILRKSSSSPMVTIAASGMSSTAPILFKNLRVEPVTVIGFNIATNVEYLEFNNVQVVGTNDRTTTESEIGLKVDTYAGLSHLKVVTSTFEHLDYGWYFAKNGDWGPGGSNVTNVNVANTSFSHNDAKGIYVEKLSDATFNGCTVHNNGLDTTWWNAQWNAGFDINLKGQETYQNLIFNNMVVTNNGLDVANGAGFMIKARDDGTTYGAHPAHLDNVQINNSIFTGNTHAIRFGEPGKNNAGPTHAVLASSAITANTYGLINTTQATVTATLNWWNSPTGPTHAGNIGGAGDVISNTLSYTATTFTPWLCNGTDTSAAIGFQPNTTTLCAIPTRLVFSTQPGSGTVNDPLSVQPVVRAKDEAGNLGINFSGPVTLALSPGGATLTGVNPANAVKGVVTFSGLVVDRFGTYTLSASTPGLTRATSNPFIINPINSFPSNSHIFLPIILTTH